MAAAPSCRPGVDWPQLSPRERGVGTVAPDELTSAACWERGAVSIPLRGAWGLGLGPKAVESLSWPHSPSPALWVGRLPLKGRQRFLPLDGALTKGLAPAPLVTHTTAAPNFPGAPGAPEA